jgi:molybdate transport system substrate-binding protein
MNTGISVISSMATRQLLFDAVDAWRRRGGGDVVLEAMGGVDAARRVREGAAFDVVVLAEDAIDTLAADGCIVRGTERDLARSEVAIAVRRGAAHPVVDTEEALRRAVLAARTIGHSTGPSGVALQKLFDRWGIVAQVHDRLVQAPPGVPVGALLARGEVELGFQQLAELMHLEGVDVIGPMPPGLQIVTTFSAGVCAASRRPEAAQSFLEFIGSPAADDLKRHHGMEPA